MFTVAALCGSIRRDSYNQIFLEALRPLMPAGLRYSIVEGVGDVPLFCEDIDTDPALSPVAALRSAIAEADGIIIASPEYNQSIPGVLKNALDWLSRPHGHGALNGKVVLNTVVTLSRGNGARGLSDLNRIVSYLGNSVLYQPEIVIASAPSVLVRRNGSPEIVDVAIRDLVVLALQLFESVMRTDAAKDSAALLAAQRRVIERARFTPLIREAILRGAPPEAIENRLRNAGISRDTAQDWIGQEAMTMSAAHNGNPAAHN